MWGFTKGIHPVASGKSHNNDVEKPKNILEPHKKLGVKMFVWIVTRLPSVSHIQVAGLCPHLPVSPSAANTQPCSASPLLGLQKLDDPQPPSHLIC